MQRLTIFLFLTGILTMACGQNNSRSSPNLAGQNQSAAPTNSPVIYSIEGEDIVLRKGPGDKYEKLINEKATRALNSTEYLQVDYTVKVNVLEENGAWSKIKVVDPEWLSSTHVGWIPTKHILKQTSDNQLIGKALNPKDYEIIKMSESSSVQNFHLLIKNRDFDRESVFALTTAFRKQICRMDCNVSLYDTKSIEPLIDKRPLKREEYIKLADHYVSMSTFDSVDVKSWYPFQDFQYKEFGGKNWKKPPIN